MIKFKKLFRAGIFLAVFGMVVSVLATNPAYAAEPIPTRCHGFGAGRIGIETVGGETYSYSGKFRNPSSSGCSDINVSWIDNLASPPGQPYSPSLESCAYIRVRFYPSSGGNYANDWKYICQDVNSTQSDTIATGVRDNTLYRIETWGTINFAYSVWD